MKINDDRKADEALCIPASDVAPDYLEEQENESKILKTNNRYKKNH